MDRQMAVVGAVRPTGKYYKHLPDDPAKFHAWRRRFLAAIRARPNREFTQETIWRMCREDLLFFVKVFLEPTTEDAQPVSHEAWPV